MAAPILRQEKCAYNNNNNIIYKKIILPELPSSAILLSTPEHNQHNQRCLLSACLRFLLNVNSAVYVDLRSGVLSKMVEPLMSHGIFY